jgi:hypothetical protein
MDHGRTTVTRFQPKINLLGHSDYKRYIKKVKVFRYKRDVALGVPRG